MKYSKHQLNVMRTVANRNVIVDAVAGSGKTTTILGIAEKYPMKNILLITYNARLKKETRDKVESLGYDNIGVHTYHSAGQDLYTGSGKCRDDIDMLKIFENNLEPICDVKYGCVILDEGQDMTKIHWQLICVIMRDYMEAEPWVCILGDKFQSIYEYNGADCRYITHADKIFTFNARQWSKLSLPQSFRTTIPMAEFINLCALHDTDRTIISTKPSEDLPIYVRTAKPKDIVPRIMKELETYEPDDIFILAASVKCIAEQSNSMYNPIVQVANTLTKNGISVYVPTSDDSSLDSDVIKGKVTFASFHQVKGLERSVSFILGFDESYFTYYDKDGDPTVCPNPLYVALTRSTDKMYMIHFCGEGYLPFLNLEQLTTYTDYNDSRGDINPVMYPNTTFTRAKRCDLNRNVTKLCKNIRTHVLSKIINMVNIEVICPPGDRIDIPMKVRQHNNSHEFIADLTGNAIPTYMQIVTDHKCDTIDQYLKCSEGEAKKFARGASKYDTQLAEINKMIQSGSGISVKDLLYFAVRWDGMNNGLKYRKKQITKYDWITEDQLTKCCDRLRKTIDTDDHGMYESPYTKYITRAGVSVAIKGRTDIETHDTVVEIKCVSRLLYVHYAQLIMYMYLTNNRAKKYCLYNVLTDENISISCNDETLCEIVNMIVDDDIRHNDKVTDAEFVAQNLSFRNCDPMMIELRR